MSIRCILAASRPWYSGMADRLRRSTGAEFHGVTTSDELARLDLDAIAPRYVFVPHWSWIIPEAVWRRFETVVFHMTDLPYGRGGSPLQNMIVRGLAETKISAFRCTAELDAGPVYMKCPLSLLGNAEEIYLRASSLIETMIRKIIHDEPEAQPQEGMPTLFARRSPDDGDLAACRTLDDVHDRIRMLDAEGYPPAFLRSGPFTFEFSRAIRRCDRIEADVAISIAESDT